MLRRNRRRRITSPLLLLLILMVFSMGIGYAAISQTLEIDGTTDIDSASWNVHFDNVSVNPSSVSAEDPVITNNTSVSFSVNLEEPGDIYEFDIDVINSGTMNAKIDGLSILPVLTAEQEEYFTYEVAYSDGTAIQVGDALDAGSTETINVYFTYIDIGDTSLYPTDDVNFDFSISLNYIQGTGNVVAHPTFETDSWDTIVANVQNGFIPDTYKVGMTKEISLASYGTRTVRLVNTSTPEECGYEGFSQTACGFVLEFVDIVTTNKFGSTNNNAGGWESSSLRNYMNNTLYSRLPENIQNGIISTNVVSGHGQNDSDNFVTYDFLYAASPQELGITYNQDSASTLTRTLDWYQTHTQYEDYIKNTTSGSATAYWMRTVPNDSGTYASVISSTGQTAALAANSSNGIAALFRLGLDLDLD